MAFEVLKDIQIIFHGNSPSYLESRAYKIMVREERDQRSSSSKTVAVTSQSSLLSAESRVHDFVVLPLNTPNFLSYYYRQEGCILFQYKYL